MNQSRFVYVLLGLALLIAAAAFGLFGTPDVKSGGVACGLAIAGGLSLVASALVVRRGQADEATIRTMERRIFDLESELEARAGERHIHDEEP
jgi:hypothetical protein